MTPLEQTFWCQQYKVYIEYESRTTTKWDVSRKSSLEKADLDLEEFRKRFGGDEVKTPSTTLYPWELLPEWVTDCATDKDGESCGYNHPPVIDLDFEDEWMYGEEFNDYNHMTFKDLGLENVPVLNWRQSLEKRPGGGV